MHVHDMMCAHVDTVNDKVLFCRTNEEIWLGGWVGGGGGGYGASLMNNYNKNVGVNYNERGYNIR